MFSKSLALAAFMLAGASSAPAFAAAGPGAATPVPRIPAIVLAQAADGVITIPVPGTVDTIALRYACADGTTVAVDYINAGAISLAVLHFPAELVVAANVMAGSGAKYEGDRFTWWTKGNEADLYDLTKGDTPVHCGPAP